MELVEVVFPDEYDNNQEWGSKRYGYLNKYGIAVYEGDIVIVKAGTGGTKEVLVKNVLSISPEDIKTKYKGYKYILENISRNRVNVEPLRENHKYVYDIRFWREQKDAYGGFTEQWSDLIKTCNCEESLKLKEKVNYSDTIGKVVNIRQLPVEKVGKLEFVKPRAKKKGFLRKLFGR